MQIDCLITDWTVLVMSSSIIIASWSPESQRAHRNMINQYKLRHVGL